MDRQRGSSGSISRSDDPPDDSHVVPRHVLYHHPGPDLRGVCRTNEIQRHGSILGPVGHFDLLSEGQLLGLLEGGSLLKAQFIAVLCGWGLAVVGTFVILKVIDALMGLRVSREAEIEGLDLSQHNEEGYIFI